MSLEKEAFEYAIDKKQIPTDFKKGTFYFDKEGLISFLSDFANQKTEKLSNELEQTKEKLKRCEEFIDKLKDEVFEGKSKITGRLQREGEQLLSQLKDNG